MSKRILVVEDQEDNMRIMNDMLSSAGYQVIKAVTGHEGVVMAESHKPDSGARCYNCCLRSWRSSHQIRTKQQVRK